MRCTRFYIGCHFKFFMQRQSLLLLVAIFSQSSKGSYIKFLEFKFGLLHWNFLLERYQRFERGTEKSKLKVLIFISKNKGNAKIIRYNKQFAKNHVRHNESPLYTSFRY